MFYLMKSKYAIFLISKVTKFKHSAFLGTPIKRQEVCELRKGGMGRAEGGKRETRGTR